VAGLSLGVNFVLSSRKAKAELEMRVEEYISALTDALKVPLWNYSEETITAICTSYAQNEFVVKLRLVDPNGSVFFNQEKVDQELVVERSRDIYYQDNHIGRVHIALASGYYTAVIRQLFQSFSLTILIMIGALLVMTGVLLRQFLNKPMSRFTKMVDAYAAGDPDAFKQDTPYREFRPLVDVLDKMGEKIASQMKSLKLIQYAIDNSSVATYWINPEGFITYVNQAACKSLGYAEDEFVNLPVSEIDPLWPAEQWSERLEKIKSEGSLTFESVHRRKDGGTFPVEVTATFLVFDQAEYIFAFAADITHRKQAEKEIKKLNQELEKRVEERTAALRKLSEAVEQSPVAVLITDKKGAIEYVNPRFSEMTGYSAKEAIGQNPRILKSGHHPDSFYKDLWDTILSGRTWRGEILNRKKNDEEFWESTSVSAIKNDDGEISHFVAAKQDITDQKQAEEVVRNSQQRLGQIIDFLPDPTWVIDSEGKVVTWNQAMEKLTGIAAGDMVGKGDYEYALPFYGERRPVLIDLVREWNPEYEKKYRSIKKVGQKLVSESYHPHLGDGGLHLSGNASLIYDANGQVAGAIESLRDTTEHKHMEDDLRRNLEELERFNRLAYGRELKMIQLKEEINELLSQLNQDKKYKIVK
jgi:PAS domain S-box-containing protein